MATRAAGGSLSRPELASRSQTHCFRRPSSLACRAEARLNRRSFGMRSSLPSGARVARLRPRSLEAFEPGDELGEGPDALVVGISVQAERIDDEGAQAGPAG